MERTLFEAVHFPRCLGGAPHVPDLHASQRLAQEHEAAADLHAIFLVVSQGSKANASWSEGDISGVVALDMTDPPRELLRLVNGNGLIRFDSGRGEFLRECLRQSRSRQSRFLTP